MNSESNDMSSTDQFQPQPQKTPAKSRTGLFVLWGIFTALSVVANIILVIALIVVSMAFVSQDYDQFSEETLLGGSKSHKIVVINVKGIILDQAAEDVSEQVKAAGEDDDVAAVIVKIDSPGGEVASSDRINYEIRKLREKYNKPTVAFLQSMAASGGYYSAVACDKIVAEPTVITGSIGVLVETFELQKLLEEKLGVKAVVLKSGEKKDWPSMFRPVTAEQEKYVNDKLVKPAYERFVSVVIQGRKMLDREQVLALADGSIYSAKEALDSNLIDEIGYFDKAVEKAKALAKVKSAQVVEYKKQFSFTSFLEAKSQAPVPMISRDTLTEFSQPKLLYLWNGRN
jgi:protease-4